MPTRQRALIPCLPRPWRWTIRRDPRFPCHTRHGSSIDGRAGTGPSRMAGCARPPRARPPGSPGMRTGIDPLAGPRSVRWTVGQHPRFSCRARHRRAHSRRGQWPCRYRNVACGGLGAAARAITRRLVCRAQHRAVIPLAPIPDSLAAQRCGSDGLGPAADRRRAAGARTSVAARAADEVRDGHSPHRAHRAPVPAHPMRAAAARAAALRAGWVVLAQQSPPGRDEAACLERRRVRMLDDEAVDGVQVRADALGQCSVEQLVHIRCPPRLC